jgi:hypothetical protein
MSGSHAEASHGHGEHMESNESAMETLGEGIKKIIASVGIAIKKVYNGFGGFFKDVFGGLMNSDSSHHAESHGGESHAAGHEAPPAAAHH